MSGPSAFHRPTDAARLAALATCLLLAAAGASTSAWAQAAPAPADAPAAAQPGAPAANAPAPAGAAGTGAAAPKYSAADIKTIFSYLDRNHDGSISRDEAASFKGVARNFDRADTDKDGVLSFKEFEFAMMQAK